MGAEGAGLLIILVVMIIIIIIIVTIIIISVRSSGLAIKSHMKHEPHDALHL